MSNGVSTTSYVVMIVLAIGVGRLITDLTSTSTPSTPLTSEEEIAETIAEIMAESERKPAPPPVRRVMKKTVEKPSVLRKPKGAADYIVLPKCGDGWGLTEVPKGWRFTTDGPSMIHLQGKMQPIGTKDWVDYDEVKIQSGIRAIMFCADHPFYVKYKMKFKWTPL